MGLNIANKNASSASHEREVEEHISTADPSHRGYSLIRTLLDSFEIKGPEGSHSCLVYPPMREPLSIYQWRFEDRKMPLPLIKTYLAKRMLVWHPDARKTAGELAGHPFLQLRETSA